MRPSVIKVLRDVTESQNCDSEVVGRLPRGLAALLITVAAGSDLSRLRETFWKADTTAYIDRSGASTSHRCTKLHCRHF